jgi:vacuolar-type H+-ATPase subunit H
MEGSTNSIKSVQAEEQKAKVTVAKAEADGVKAVEDAKVSAVKILEAGELEAAETAERIVGGAENAIAAKRATVSKKIDSYVSHIHKIRLSKKEVGEAAEKISREIS